MPNHLCLFTSQNITQRGECNFNHHKLSGEHNDIAYDAKGLLKGTKGAPINM